MSSIPSRNQFLALVFKTYTEGDIKVFWSCLILPDFLTFYQILCLGLPEETNFCLWLFPVSFLHQYLGIFNNFQVSLERLMEI